MQRAQLTELAASSQRLSEQFARLSALYTRASLATQPDTLWEVLDDLSHVALFIGKALKDYSEQTDALELM